jgi:hypothetical protein
MEAAALDRDSGRWPRIRIAAAAVALIAAVALAAPRISWEGESIPSRAATNGGLRAHVALVDSSRFPMGGGTPGSDPDFGSLAAKVTEATTLHAQDPGFGGVWLDPAGSRVTVAVTAAADRSIVEEIRGMFPSGVEVTAVDVRFTLAELNAAEARFGGLTASGRAFGAYLYLPDNRVTVTVASQEDADALAPMLGPIAQFELGGPPTVGSLTH